MGNFSCLNSRKALSKATVMAALLSSSAWAFPALAKDTAPAEPAAQTDTSGTTVSPTGDIMVTARRKSENILSTPIAISALSNQDLKDRGVVSLQDIANYVPGLNFVAMATAGGRTDRSFQQIVLRGIAPATSAAQTTSVFIDGVPVASAIGVQNVTDPERVEVLKGPQAAYFGRQTFAGAINIVNRLPSDHLTGSIDASVGTRNNHDITATLSAPIFGDVLGFRITGEEWQKGGSYQNGGVAGQTLGNQRTRTLSGELVFKPADSLTIKAYGLYTQNNDGPAATGLISAYGITNGGTVVTPNRSNCTLAGHPFVCGTLGGNATVSAGSVLTAGETATLASGVGRYVSPGQGVQGFGLVARNYHAHVTADWKLGDGFTLSSLTGYNHGMMSELADFGNYYSTTSSYPYLVEGVTHDFSQEVRLSYDKGGPFHAMIGGSYLYSYGATDAGGAYLTSLTTASTTPLAVSTAGPSETKTLGFFYGMGYAVTPKLTIDFEGRYQSDKILALSAPGGTTITTSAFGTATGFYAGNSVLLQKSYDNFMPRVIANYKIDPNNMVYASYSTAVNPGQFNTAFLTGSPSVVALAAANGVKLEVQPEKIINYEIGAKGRVAGGKLRYELAAFMDYWYNQINNTTQSFIDSTGAAQQLIALTNSGRVRILGLEADLSYAVTPQLTLSANGAYIDSYILSQANTSVTQLTGLTNFRGKQDPFTSKWSGTLAATYTKPLGNNVDGYTRVDFTYKSGSYTDVANITRTPDMNQVNLHLGARNKIWSAEAYVTNLFDNKAYYSAGDGYAVPYFAANSAVIVQLRDLRTVGVKVGYKF